MDAISTAFVVGWAAGIGTAVAAWFIARGHVRRERAAVDRRILRAVPGPDTGGHVTIRLDRKKFSSDNHYSAIDIPLEPRGL